MPRIKCDWMTCIHNSSKVAGVAGNCGAERVEFSHVDTDCQECMEPIEGLECLTYEREPNKGIEEDK